MQPNDPNQQAAPVTSSASGTLLPDQHPAPNQPQTPQPRAKNKLIILVVAALVAIIGIVVVLWSLFGGTKTMPSAPTLTVGSQPYIYACSVVTTDTLTENLNLNNDKIKQAAEEVYAFAPFTTNAKQLDVLKETGRSHIPSTCRVKLDITPSTSGNPISGASFTLVSVTIQQYADAQAAKADYEKAKNEAGDKLKAFPSFADSSFYTPPAAATAGGPVLVSQVALYKNLIISYLLPTAKGDASGEMTATRMDLTHKDVLKRIDAGEGRKPKDYSGITKIGDNPFYDACQNTDFSKISQAIGSGVDFDISLFTSSQQYMAQSSGATDSPELAASICNNYFRTKEDSEAQAKLSKDQTDSQEFRKYPHTFMVQVLTAKNSQDAQKVLTIFRKSGDSPEVRASGVTMSDVSLGDKAIKVFTPASSSAPQDGYLYYIAKDSHVYAISILLTKQSEPYKTTTTAISDDQMKRIYEALLEGVTSSKK